MGTVNPPRQFAPALNSQSSHRRALRPTVHPSIACRIASDNVDYVPFAGCQRVSTPRASHAAICRILRKHKELAATDSMVRASVYETVPRCSALASCNREACGSPRARPSPGVGPHRPGLCSNVPLSRFFPIPNDVVYKAADGHWTTCFLASAPGVSRVICLLVLGGFSRRRWLMEWRG